jgi:hypothetical protein
MFAATEFGNTEKHSEFLTDSGDLRLNRNKEYHAKRASDCTLEIPLKEPLPTGEHPHGRTDHARTYSHT